MAAAPDLNKFPRPLTDIEWGFYSKTFPNLQREHVTALGPKNTKFNCISWSLGFEDRWIDVGETKEGLVTLCKIVVRSNLQASLIGYRRALFLHCLRDC